MPPSLPPKPLFGRRLRQARESRQMSQVDLGLAALEGVDERQAGARISKYELGVHKPKFETIEKFAKALGIPAGYFFTQSEEMSQAILLLAELPAHKQREAVALLRKMVEANKPK